MKPILNPMDISERAHHPIPDLNAFLSGPLHIDFVPVPQGGEIGLTHCPGRNQVDPRGRVWRRDLSADLDAMMDAGIQTVITFLDQQELSRMGAGELPVLVQSRPFRWVQLPITDFGVPSEATVLEWCGLLKLLLDQLHSNERILLHCAAGLGRSGMMAATLLKALGMATDDAIQLIRQSRPGTVETPEQEQFVRDFKWFSGA
jgi:ADP-ribosyl-[dinitrogen reductase] hydrolase